MNKAITGAWGGGGGGGGSRRTRISLNAPVPPPGSAAAAALAAKLGAQVEEGTPGSNGVAAASERTETLGGKVTPAAEVFSEAGPSSLRSRSGTATPAGGLDDVSAPSTPLSSAAAAAGKRKVRASRDGGGAGSTTTTSSSASKRAKQQRRVEDIADKHTPPTTRLADLGGITNAIEKVLELIAMPLCHPEIFQHTGVKPPRGVLLHGPPGCGKTMLAGAIAGELGVPFLSVSAPSIVSGTSGESEKTLRETFEEAARIAPCILFIDEIDAITPKRETAQREMERRIVAQLLTCLDDLDWDKNDGNPVMVIGATNRPDSLDPALRRAGRFDHEIALGVPDEDGREQILRVISSTLRLSGDFDFRALAKSTPGFVGADLAALTGAAGIIAVKRIFKELGMEPNLPVANGISSLSLVQDSAHNTTVGEPTVARLEDAEMADGAALVDEAHQNAEESADLLLSSGPTSAAPIELTALPGKRSVQPSASFFDAMAPTLQLSSIATFLRTHPNPLTANELAPLSITNADFILALPTIQPSSKREGFAVVPDVTWSDVGALHDIREELAMAIVQPIRRPELFASVGVSASCGVLLWGPPGCGKTLLAKAVANESRANFISVKGPELLNKYVGESERAVRQVFARARASAPCVIFFDELDALVPRRDDALSESSSRVVNTLLTELDGLESRVQTYVIGATNRPDMIDPAMCRPGRLDRLLYVDLPGREERADILRTVAKKMPLSDEARRWIENVASGDRMDGYSGADLAALAREAAVAALREQIASVSSVIDGSDGLSSSASFRAGVESAAAQAPTISIDPRHFDAALRRVQPSVTLAQRRKYLGLKSKLQGPSRGLQVQESTAVPPNENDEGNEKAADVAAS